MKALNNSARDAQVMLEENDEKDSATATTTEQRELRIGWS
jgi:hypothetical protein